MPEGSEAPLAVDIAIVGEGLTALAAAAILSVTEPDWRICLMTAGGDSLSRACCKEHQARTIALSAGSLEILEKLFAVVRRSEAASGDIEGDGKNLYERIIASSAAITTIQVSDRGHGGLARLQAEANCPPLGRVTENTLLLSHLKAFVAQRQNVQCISGLPVRSLQPKQQGFVVRGEGCNVSAHFLLVADGSDSPARKLLGIQQKVIDYGQTAVVAIATLAEPHGGAAYERFTSEGPVALLPMIDGSEGEHRASLVWTLPNDEAKALKDQLEAINEASCKGTSLAQEDLLERLHRAFGQRAGIITGIHHVVWLPLKRKHAEEQVRSHLALMGSAAFGLHPVAGQGFNLTLRDIAALAEVLLQGERQHRPLGQLVDLQHYLEGRARDQRRTISISDQLPRLFTSKSPAIILSRNMGLNLLSLNAGLRSAFVRTAAGQVGRQARLGGGRRVKPRSLPQDWSHD